MLRHLIETALNSENVGWRMEGVILWSVGTGYALLRLCTGILWPRSHSFLPVLASSERGDAAQRPHRMKISPSKHTFLMVASKRERQKLYMKKKKKKNPGQGVKEEEWGMEDGQICREGRKCC